MRRICIPRRAGAAQLHERALARLPMRRKIRVLPRFWRFVSLLMALIFGACALSSEMKYRRCCAHLAEVQLARNEAARRVDELSQRLAEVQTDAYVEELARRELNLLYPGEIRYVAR